MTWSIVAHESLVNRKAHSEFEVRKNQIGAVAGMLAFSCSPASLVAS
jgi:hypothetical protein